MDALNRESLVELVDSAVVRVKQELPRRLLIVRVWSEQKCVLDVLKDMRSLHAYVHVTSHSPHLTITDEINGVVDLCQGMLHTGGLVVINTTHLKRYWCVRYLHYFKHTLRDIATVSEKKRKKGAHGNQGVLFTSINIAIKCHSAADPRELPGTFE